MTFEILRALRFKSSYAFFETPQQSYAESTVLHIYLLRILGKIPNASLQWRHNGRDGVQLHNCLLNRLFRRRSKKTSKLHVTGLCAGNSPVTDGQWRGKCFHLMTSSWFLFNRHSAWLVRTRKISNHNTFECYMPFVIFDNLVLLKVALQLGFGYDMIWSLPHNF